MAIVNGPGSTWNTGAEWFWVATKAAASSPSPAAATSLADFSVEGGVVAVDGTGSTLAYEGGPHINGMFSITNGGDLCSGTFTNYVSYIEADGFAKVNGAGSTWKEAATISIGASGGTLYPITGGGSVTANAAILDA